jgi:hypothetical protein
LAWPAGWHRTAPASRLRARFLQKSRRYSSDGRRSYLANADLTLATSLSRLHLELGRLNAVDEILSTNVPLRLDGLPRSDQKEPQDPGAAVYFALLGKPRTLACDRWTRVADNIAAIAAHIEAIRAVDRYGVGTLEQAFAGYAALPSSTQAWWEVLGVPPNADREAVDEAFRLLAKRAHPDAGGPPGEMARTTVARASARKALGG